MLNKEYAGSLSIIESKLPTISVVDPKNATIGSLLIDAIQKQVCTYLLPTGSEEREVL